MRPIQCRQKKRRRKPQVRRAPPFPQQTWSFHVCCACNKTTSRVLNKSEFAIIQVDEEEENAGFLARHKQAVVALIFAVVVVCCSVLVYSWMSTF